MITRRLSGLYGSHSVATALRVAQAGYIFKRLSQEESIMSKGQDSKKNTKKKPLLTAKEKKAAKTAKKAASNVLGN